MLGPKSKRLAETPTTSDVFVILNLGLQTAFFPSVLLKERQVSFPFLACNCTLLILAEFLEEPLLDGFVFGL